jgi:hypothetical protein
MNNSTQAIVFAFKAATTTTIGDDFNHDKKKIFFAKTGY